MAFIFPRCIFVNRASGTCGAESPGLFGCDHMVYEYVYVWDRKQDKCVATWYVRSDEAADRAEPRTSHGPIAEEAFDEHVKKLLAKYPEPRYLVDGGESLDADGLRATLEFIRQIKAEEKELSQEKEKGF